MAPLEGQLRNAGLVQVTLAVLDQLAELGAGGVIERQAYSGIGSNIRCNSGVLGSVFRADRSGN